MYHTYKMQAISPSYSTKDPTVLKILKQHPRLVWILANISLGEYDNSIRNTSIIHP